jgi:glycerol uptake facilitator-like aquaporin
MDLSPLYKMASSTQNEKRYVDQTLLPPPTTSSTAAELHAATSTDHPQRRHHAHLLHKAHTTSNRPLAGGIQFAGRLGGNQSFVLDRSDPLNAALLARVPDAAPYMSISSQLSPHGFFEPDLWRAAFLEGIATLLLCYLTIYASLSPSSPPLPPTPRYGPFNNAAFIGPIVGAFVNWLSITLFTFTFSPITGAHLNPTITLATFFARLTTLPRAVLYISAQSLGAALAGLLIRATVETTHFKAGGCFLFPDLVSPSSAFVLELLSTITLLFLAFGVGLDPRQRSIIPPAAAPIFVGGISALLTIGTSFNRYGYGGAGLNPARCLGVFVGSGFPSASGGNVDGVTTTASSWHWVHWVASLVGGIVHGGVYHMVPPWRMMPPVKGNGVAA